MKLTREVRFSLSRDRAATPIANSWGGWPPACGLDPYLVMRTTVRGQVDPRTGYLCNITVIDRAVREQAIPLIRLRWLDSERRLCCESLMGDVRRALEQALPGGIELEHVEIRTTPHLAFGLAQGVSSMVSITQSFEFSAAHRLFCSDLSDEENLATFGKCTNASGHGHNYVVEVTIEGAPDSSTGVVLPLSDLERTVKAEVIERFDHKHLNADCEEFADLNPSVENITRIIWQKLQGRFGQARLACVRVYETPKTCAEYRGDCE